VGNYYVVQIAATTLVTVASLYWSSRTGLFHKYGFVK